LNSFQETNNLLEVGQQGGQPRMTTIDKLLIQGIRSFSPQNRNIIEFYQPLTLIVGPNGAGKTVRCVIQRSYKLNFSGRLSSNVLNIALLVTCRQVLRADRLSSTIQKYYYFNFVCRLRFECFSRLQESGKLKPKSSCGLETLTVSR